MNCCLIYWLTNNYILTGQQLVNNILFNDDDDDELPKGSGLRERVAGTMMEVEADCKKKKSNGEDITYNKVKDWVLQYVITEFKDHNKQKYLLAVVVLPTGVTYYNTTNTDTVVGSTQEELIIKFIWLHKMMDVKSLLGQSMTS